MIDSDALVERIRPFVIRISDRYLAFCSRLERLSCPFHVSTSAGCRHIVYDGRLVALVGDVEFACDRAIIQHHLSEIMYHLVNLQPSADLFLCCCNCTEIQEGGDADEYSCFYFHDIFSFVPYKDSIILPNSMFEYRNYCLNLQIECSRHKD